MTLPAPYYSRDGTVIYHGDCLEILPELPSGSVDAVVTDPPLGITQCDWDNWVLGEEFWQNAWRMLVVGGPIVLFSSGGATVRLFREAHQWFRWKLCWDRVGKVSGYLDANKRPMRRHEDISVFCQSAPLYRPTKRRGVMAKASVGSQLQSALYGKSIKKRAYCSDERFPVDVIRLVPPDSRCRVHPTQKPVELMELLSLWHTPDAGSILDPFLGSGTTAVACIKTGRKCIGIELSEKYCEIAARRCEEAFASQALFRQQEVCA